MNEKLIQELSASIHRMAATDPASDLVEARVKDVFQKVANVKASIAAGEREIAPARSETIVENPSVIEHIDQMRAAAAVPAANYGRIVSLLDGLRHAALLASRPQHAAVRPRISSIVQKVAGIFAEIDTVEDLNKPLEQIEKAVHALYGDQGKNGCFYFERRGKGHHKSDSTEE